MPNESQPNERNTPTRWSDYEIEQLLGNLLRIGVWTAALVVAVGALVYLAQHGDEAPRYRVFRGEPETLREVTRIVPDAFAWQGEGIIQLGLLLLIATPVLRVIFAAIFFCLQRDYLYVAVSVMVLALLALGLSGVVSH
jgi:uncharacterized membrane protein